MNNIEEKLWDYIDGNCTPDEQQAISNLIESNELYCQKYHELLVLNLEFGHLELDEPPMAFTYNVMEAVRAEAASVPLRAAINKNVIRGLAGVFVFFIAAIIGYALVTINWHSGNTGGYELPQFKMPNLKEHLSSSVIKAFVFFDIILLLFLGDAYLRRKHVA